jgi:N-acetylglucosaminyl-diphospho-decaprenol L-rhamnosyltransferase
MRPEARADDAAGRRAAPATLADLTIVVVTWESVVELPALLASLAPVLRGGAELVVIDNASSDETVATLRRLAPETTVIANPENRGFAAAANQGLAASRRSFVLWLNPDVTVEAGAVARALAYLDETPAFALVGCKTLNGDGTPQPTVDRFHGVRRLAAEAWRGRAGAARGTSPTTSGAVEWVYGSFMLGRRAALAAVGGFDEAYEMYGEDLDLCHRLHAAGFGVGYCAEAVIVHHGNRSGARRYGPERDRAVLQGTLRFFRRRRGPLATLGFRVAAGALFACKAAARAAGARHDGSARLYAGMAWLCLTGDPAGRAADRARLRVRHAPGIEGP